MPQRWIFKIVCLAFLLILAGRCSADVNPEIIKRGKEATALVEIEGGKGFGTAFCIDPVGLFVTNAHVAEAAGEGTKLVLVLHPGEKEQKKLAAKVIRVDHETDLALLRVESKEPLTALKLGQSDSLVETAEIIVFGYPFGDALAVGNEDYPTVTVSTGHITALRKAQGKLAAIQLDASVNHGNSGGPLLDNKGQVVGIVAAGIEGAGINFAIPVGALHDLMRKVTILFNPDPIPGDRQHQKRDFTIQLVSLVPLPANVRVEFLLTAGTGEPRRFLAQSTDGHTFQVSAIPVPITSRQNRLQLVVQDDSSELVCQAQDREITVAGKTLSLSQVSHIESGPKPKVTLADGQVLDGFPSGLEAVATQLVGMKTVLNLNKASQIAVTDLSNAVSSVLYHIGVYRDQELLNEMSGTLIMTGEENAALQAEKLTGAVLFSIDEAGNADGTNFWITGGAESFQLYLRQGTRWLNAGDNTIALTLTPGLHTFAFNAEPGDRPVVRCGLNLFFNHVNNQPGLSVLTTPATTHDEKPSWAALAGKTVGLDHNERLAPGGLIFMHNHMRVELVSFQVLRPGVEKADLVSGNALQPNGNFDFTGTFTLRVTRRNN